jgi:hypothetical protein
MMLTFERPRKIVKQLSCNDTGETGGHQAGILVPRDSSILSFFPSLDSKEYNPRLRLVFRDVMSGKWEFAFIYYNNKFFGGTRNEYRLTCMTAFMRSHNLRAGDTLTLTRDDDGHYHIAYTRQNEYNEGDDDKLRMRNGGAWKVVKI